jgi:hypothetical protein
LKINSLKFEEKELPSLSLNVLEKIQIEPYDFNLEYSKHLATNKPNKKFTFDENECDKSLVNSYREVIFLINVKLAVKSVSCNENLIYRKIKNCLKLL